MKDMDKCATSGCWDPIANKGKRLCAACSRWQNVWSGRPPAEVANRVRQIHRLNTRTVEMVLPGLRSRRVGRLLRSVS